MNGQKQSLRGRRVLITGAARGIGAALAERLHDRGARVALAGLEPDRLAATAERVGAPWWTCDVSDRRQVDEVVTAAVEALGGLDVVIANAGVAAQLPLVGGDPAIFEQTLRVNVLGTYYTLRAAERGDRQRVALVVGDVRTGGAVHPPLLGAYSASKAAVEALGNALRQEVRGAGARVGVAYFAELDTDMTSRGFGTEAAAAALGGRAFTRVTPLRHGIDALERGITRRSRRIVAPWWVAGVLPVRTLAQRVVEVAARGNIDEALRIAREEQVGLTTPQPAPRDRSEPEPEPEPEVLA